MTPFQVFKQKWQKGCGSGLCAKAANIVLCKGRLPCDILLIGEAPGQSEDVLGVPFVGPAGHLLDRINEAAGLENYRLGFTNLVCCIPLGEEGHKVAEPSKEAIKACAPRLKEFVWLARPKLIVLVGVLAKKNVFGQAQFSNDNIDYTIPWIPSDKHLGFVEITHPAAILRANPATQGLMEQKCVVALRQAIEDYLDG